MKALTIGWVNIKRMVRERSNIFFVFIFPIALVLLIGVQFGGGFAPIVGVNQADADPISDEVVSSLQSTDSIEVRIYEDVEEMTTAVERGGAQAGVILPPGMGDTAESGQIVDIGLAVEIGHQQIA